MGTGLGSALRGNAANARDLSWSGQKLHFGRFLQKELPYRSLRDVGEVDEWLILEWHGD